jgi:hypothetical protein
MAELPKSRYGGSIQPGEVLLTGSMAIGAAGAISSQTGNRACGVTWRRNAAGDYRATLHKAYRKFKCADAAIVFAALATVPTLAAGNDAAWAGVTAGMLDGSAGVGAAEVLGIITYRTDTDVLADPTNGTFITWTLVLAENL